MSKRYLGFDIPFDDINQAIFNKNDAKYSTNTYIETIEELLPILELNITYLQKYNKEEYRNAYYLLMINTYKTIETILLLIKSRRTKIFELERALIENIINFKYINLDKSQSEFRSLCFLYHSAYQLHDWMKKNSSKTLNEGYLKKKEFKQVKKIYNPGRPFWFQAFKIASKYQDLANKVFNKESNWSDLYKKLCTSVHCVDIESHLIYTLKTKKLEPHSIFSSEKSFKKTSSLFMHLALFSIFSILDDCVKYHSKKRQNIIYKHLEAWFQKYRLIHAKKDNDCKNHFKYFFKERGIDI